MKICGLDERSSDGGPIAPLQLERNFDMPSPLPLFRLALCLLISFALLNLPVSLANSVPNLGGTYEITETTDLGSSVRITVQLHLVNASSSAVTITNVGVPSRHSLPFHSVSAAHTFQIAANSSSQVSLQFQVSKQDYDTWSALPVGAFILTLQMANGRPATLNVHVPRIPS